LGDTWTWNGATWTELSPATSPPARASAVLASDPATGQLVLFGGNSTNGNLADTWAYQFPQAPVITSGSSATYTVDTAGTFTVTASGSPTPILSETGALPTGVSFRDNHDGTASLNGTPQAGTEGVYVLTLSASNGISPDASQFFTMTVGTAPPTTHRAYLPLVAR
jgi:hypothetical protein